MKDLRVVDAMEVNSSECLLSNYASDLWQQGKISHEERDNLHRLAHELGKVVYLSPTCKGEGGAK